MTAYDTADELLDMAYQGEALTKAEVELIRGEVEAARAEVKRLTDIMDRALAQGQDDIGLSDAYGILQAERTPDPCAGCGQHPGFGHISGCPALI